MEKPVEETKEEGNTQLFEAEIPVAADAVGAKGFSLNIDN